MRRGSAKIAEAEADQMQGWPRFQRAKRSPAFTSRVIYPEMVTVLS